MIRRMRAPVSCAAATLAAAVSVAAVADPALKPEERARPAAAPIETSIALRVPRGEWVAFRGVVAGDSASGPDGQLLYPAPNAAGFLAAIVTHAVVVGSVQEGRKSRQQEAADAVLTPYRPVLDTFAHADLMQRVVARMRTPGGKRLLVESERHAQGWLVESQPVFSMTQDQRALVLDNAIAVFAGSADAGPTHQIVVRVVASPVRAENPGAHWLESHGEPIREASAGLVAMSLDLALAAVKTPVATGTGMHRTVRYYEGGVEKMERGEVLAEGCGRRLLRNLRGWLMSVPLAREAENAGDGQCGGPQDAEK
jgi:hypothetical protein